MELVGQVAQLRPQRKAIWEEVGKEIYEVFGHLPPVPVAAQGTPGIPPPPSIPLVVPQGYVPPPPTDRSKGRSGKGEVGQGTGKGVGTSNLDLLDPQSQRSRSVQRAEGAGGTAPQAGRGRSRGWPLCQLTTEQQQGCRLGSCSMLCMIDLL
eukprot:3187077-Amphidinium_carterae.5